MTTRYWIRQGGREIGPFDPDQIRQMIKNGFVAPDAPISSDRTRWIPAEAIEEREEARHSSPQGATILQQPTVPDLPQPSATGRSRKTGLAFWAVMFVACGVAAVLCLHVSRALYGGAEWSPDMLEGRVRIRDRWTPFFLLVIGIFRTPGGVPYVIGCMLNAVGVLCGLRVLKVAIVGSGQPKHQAAPKLGPLASAGAVVLLAVIFPGIYFLLAGGQEWLLPVLAAVVSLAPFEWLRQAKAMQDRRRRHRRQMALTRRHAREAVAAINTRSVTPLHPSPEPSDRPSGTTEAPARPPDSSIGSVYVRPKICPACKGAGGFYFVFTRFPGPSTCDECRGEGYVIVESRDRTALDRIKADKRGRVGKDRLGVAVAAILAAAGFAIFCFCPSIREATGNASLAVFVALLAVLMFAGGVIGFVWFCVLSSIHEKGPTTPTVNHAPGSKEAKRLLGQALSSVSEDRVSASSPSSQGRR